jgi:hypothetical protein
MVHSRWWGRGPLAQNHGSTTLIGRTHRSRNIGTSDMLHWCIEVVKGFTFNNLGTDLRAYAEHRETTLDGDQSSAEYPLLRDSFPMGRRKSSDMASLDMGNETP